MGGQSGVRGGLPRRGAHGSACYTARVRSPLAVVLVLAGCAPEPSSEASSSAAVEACEAPAEETVLATDRVFTVPHSGQPWAEPQALDVARPAKGDGHPIVVVVHGGGWVGGDKADHRADIQRLAGQGYVALSVNYRLVRGWQNRFPAATADVRCAVRWAKAHAAEIGGDASRVFAVGLSAGAHLAALLGTSPDDARLDDGTCPIDGSPSVRSVVSYYGRMDLRRAPIPDYLVAFIGREGDWMERERIASPLLQVTPATSPMLFVHGTADGVVPIDHSRLMHDAVADSELVELPGFGHGFALFSDPRAGCATLRFLRR